jgi:hypothetical protein
MKEDKEGEAESNLSPRPRGMSKALFYFLSLTQGPWGMVPSVCEAQWGAGVG